MKIKKILIANRGEIAIRISETAKKMGIQVVAIYSEVDKSAKFLEYADIKIPLIGKNPHEGYLDIDQIIQIAKDQQVDAIHPGYGFLSENATFAKKVQKNNIGFIGPSYKSINAMGDKLKAKELATKAKVETVPGGNSLVKNSKEAFIEAKQIGFPILLKAVAGGGGKGMRIVYKIEDIEDNFNSVKNEAEMAYGDNRIFVEKYIENPRHIEIQVIGDKKGNIVCLSDRECSIQRFNQKIIEESPSPFVDAEMRQKMYSKCIELAKIAKYYSVGTMEFIVDNNKNFYFLEMNTRLQVEHRVTENVINFDLVQLMIETEEGKNLPFTQDEIKIIGNSIETRICAENTAKKFIPSIGRIIYYKEPNGYNIQVDSSVREGDEVSQFYDPMIAKLITKGESRHEAILAMREALANYEIEGIQTNIEMHEAIFRDDDFIKGNISTNFIKQKYPNGFIGSEIKDELEKEFIVSAVILYLKSQENLFETEELLKKNYHSYKKLKVLIGEKVFSVTIYAYKENILLIRCNNIRMNFEYYYKFGDRSLHGTLDKDSNIKVKIQTLTSSWQLFSKGSFATVQVFSQNIFDLLQYMPKKSLEDKSKVFTSPITGKIKYIKCKEGDQIEEGDVIFAIEAMKMENHITSERSGKIAKIYKTEGELVYFGEILLEFK